MSEFDLDDNPRDPRDRYRRPKSRLPLLLGLLALVGIAIGLFYAIASRETEAPVAMTEPGRDQAGEPSSLPAIREPAAPGTLPGASRTPPEPPTTERSPLHEPIGEAEFDSPTPQSPLAGSDERLRGPLGDLAPGTQLASWLRGGDLLYTFVVSIDNIAEGRSPRLHLRFMQPEGRFRVIETDEGRVLDHPANSARYDIISDVFVAFDADAAARLYDEVYPLLSESYRELGYPDESFEQTLERAIIELLRTPILDGEVELVPLSATYAFADINLQDLSPVQKQLLRMGPANVRQIQAKLRVLARALGMPVEEFPAARIVVPRSLEESEAESLDTQWD